MYTSTGGFQALDDCVSNNLLCKDEYVLFICNYAIYPINESNKKEETVKFKTINNGPDFLENIEKIEVHDSRMISSTNVGLFVLKKFEFMKPVIESNS